MKKLIYRKFALDTSAFFITMCLTIGLIIWTIQAVNYFDFVTQDGHGLKTYFSYIVFTFPKIIHRIIPFIFFISIFYLIITYENRNELSIFWINGITKINFANKIIYISIILKIFQIWFGSFLSPLFQYKAREFLKHSNVDFFTSLIKEGKFINVVKGLTIFIESKNEDGSYTNIFLDDSAKSNSKMIYAKYGIINDSSRSKVFELYEGKVINNENTKINVFEFDQIDFNLADYSSNTITVPKIQEIPSKELLNCLFNLPSKKKEIDQFKCDQSLKNEVSQELYKRFYKPLYIPIIAIICCFLVVTSKKNISYEGNKKKIFLITFFVLVVSEASIRYLTSSNFATIICLIMPWFFFILIYLIFYQRVKYV